MGGSNSSCTNREVRIGHSLNKKEEEFLARRRKTVQQSLQKLLICVKWIEIPRNSLVFGRGRRVNLCVLESLGELSENEVPNIALLGSGGGQRAMVGLLGSLDKLQKAGLLDCVLYLSGVSGSTWCMASLYQEPDWSTKLETVKDKIVQRLSGPAVSWTDAVSKLNKYYFGKDIYCSTDIWAAMVITNYVKEINEHTLSNQWNQQSKDPFPIYTVIDKQCKQNNDADPWFEFTPYEAGYSLTGAFVETSNFGSKFENGCKIKNQPEIDMLYLQGLCGSALADEDENDKFLWEKIKEFSGWDRLLDNLKSYILDPFGRLFKPITDIGRQNQWIWGRNYNFLYNMKDEAVPPALQESQTRDYEDAGLLLNSPYFSVLRKERDIDLIISLDFSDGDPFMTVREAAETCKKLNIPFPEVNIPNGHSENPNDFYVFKGQNTPTVIHIPLFNEVNCGDKLEEWRNKYGTFQGSYSAEMITDLMEVAGVNITRNRRNLVDEIFVVTNKRKSKARNESLANFL